MSAYADKSAIFEPQELHFDNEDLSPMLSVTEDAGVQFLFENAYAIADVGGHLGLSENDFANELISENFAPENLTALAPKGSDRIIIDGDPSLNLKDKSMEGKDSTYVLSAALVLESRGSKVSAVAGIDDSVQFIQGDFALTTLSQLQDLDLDKIDRGIELAAIDIPQIANILTGSSTNASYSASESSGFGRGSGRNDPSLNVVGAFSVTQVPEPAGIAFALGLLALVFARFRRKKVSNK